MDNMLAYYVQNKQVLDEELSRSFDFDYQVIDSFDDAGNKAPEILTQNAIFVDCHYLNKDLYQVVYDLALVLQKHNYGLFVVARKNLNSMLVFIRDSLNVCEYVPEIDIVVKNQMDIYSQPFEQANAEM